MLEKKNNAIIEHFMIKKEKIIKLNGELPLTVACKYFYTYKVGSLLIETSNNEYACLTKTDIIHVIGKGLDPGLIRCEEVASYPLITIDKDETLENAMLIMATNRLKRLFIVNARKDIVGVISSSDILRIAPGLLEIAREEMLLQSVEALTEENKFSGNCDDCKEFSEFLTDVGGFALCESCIKQRQDEEDEESLIEDDEFID